MDRVEIEEDDIVLAMSDGVIDNLWDHEVLQNVVDSMHKWENGEAPMQAGKASAEQTLSDQMLYVAEEVVKAAKVIAQDPFAESPYMEKAVEEGLSIEGGKLMIILRICAYTDSLIRQNGRYQCRSCSMQAEESLRTWKPSCSATYRPSQHSLGTPIPELSQMYRLESPLETEIVQATSHTFKLLTLKIRYPEQR
jgi:hypothetical protein